MASFPPANRDVGQVRLTSRRRWAVCDVARGRHSILAAYSWKYADYSAQSHILNWEYKGRRHFKLDYKHDLRNLEWVHIRFYKTTLLATPVLLLYLVHIHTLAAWSASNNTAITSCCCCWCCWYWRRRQQARVNGWIERIIGARVIHFLMAQSPPPAANFLLLLFLLLLLLLSLTLFLLLQSLILIILLPLFVFARTPMQHDCCPC